ncbi:hypothetical protein QCA50_001460 [Cerrena zonata]|uniref:Kinesin motor domain-containing protein n=1 Tax=Cerrena zonata TaxID=2478898 RepID=A0AAW0GTC9_9APHY
MRQNQKAVARSLAGGIGSQRVDTRDVKKGLAVVPFRHSKLTEILMDYFIGEGRAVMIVNVNPYDTGYDENSHVMKFAALAKEVVTTAPTAVSRDLPKPKPGQKVRTSAVGQQKRVVSISTGNGKKAKETLLEVLEEDEGDLDTDMDDDEPINPLVDALFDEIEQLRIQLFESEMRAAIIEAEVREEIMSEMEERMRVMEARHTKMLLREVERNEMKMDAKIDMLQRSTMKPKVALKPVEESETEDEDDIENSLQQDDSMDVDDRSDSELSRSPSPLAGKGKQKAASRKVVISSDKEYDEDDISQFSDSQIHDDDEESESDDEIQSWTPGKSAKKKPTPPQHLLTSPPPLVFETDVKGLKLQSRKVSDGMGSLTNELNKMGLQGTQKSRKSKSDAPVEELRRSTRKKA